MQKELLPYFFALGANLAFSWATIVFAHFSKTASALWMNVFKATIAFTVFGLIFLFFGDHHWPEQTTLISFLLSGFLGLALGDWFLLKAFATLGASRVLMLYGFQPLMLGVAGYLLFHQSVPLEKLVAIIFLVACLFVFSLENLRKYGQWHLKALFIGLIGISLDTLGVVLTRYGFENSPSITPLDCNFYRACGAIAGFVVFSFFVPLRIHQTLLKFDRKQRALLIIASLSGTFLSLYLYLSAVRIGHLATISSIGITAPLFAGILESFVQRKLPSLYLVIAFLLFACGFLILVY